MSNIAASVFAHAVAVNKSDSPGDDPAAENQGFAGLYCTVAGSLKIQDGRNQTATFAAVAVGVIPIRCRRVWSTGTSATVLGLIST
jgi:hypothetical protein